MRLYRFPIEFPEPEILARLLSQAARGVWLDSADALHPRSCFSFICVDPLAELKIKNSSSAQVLQGTQSREIQNPWQFLEEWLQALQFSDEAETPFAGGVMGFLSYEAALRRLPLKFPVRMSDFPDAVFFLVDTAIVLDHAARRAWVLSLGLKEDLRTQDAAAAERRCVALQQRLASLSPLAANPGQVLSQETPLPREAYLQKVETIQEAIRRGDCYQVNFSQRFLAQWEGDSAALYLNLRDKSPAPQMAFMKTSDGVLLSSSPEVLCEIKGSRIRSYPIKGTRPRGENPEADRRAITALEESPKDRAELLMIVDLVRNDLGRICETASVQVPALGDIESFAQVHHRVACIEGNLRPEITALQALFALSPGGSITGAPKLKAIEIIQNLEETARGIYTGSMGYVSLNGKACFNIAIRTAFLQGTKLEFSAGGGIVADSDPQAEYEESLHKAEGIMRALNLMPY